MKIELKEKLGFLKDTNKAFKNSYALDLTGKTNVIKDYAKNATLEDEIIFNCGGHNFRIDTSFTFVGENVLFCVLSLYQICVNIGNDGKFFLDRDRLIEKYDFKIIYEGKEEEGAALAYGWQVAKAFSESVDF